MDILEVYTQAWRDILRELKNFGFETEDIRFTIRWIGIARKSPIRIRISRKLYLLFGKVANSSKDLHSFFEGIEKRPLPDTRSELLLPNILSLTDVQWLICNALHHFRNETEFSEEKRPVKRDGQVIRRGRDEIDREAARLLPVHSIKELDESHFHKKTGEFFLWVDLGLGRTRMTGKTPAEVIEALKKHLKEAEQE